MTTLDGRYALREVLGRGGSATVHRALDEREQRHVAVKLHDQGTDPRRVEAEARLGRRLDHPRLVRVLDEGTAPDGRAYLVMEMVLGQSLEQRLRLWPLSAAGATVLGAQLAEGLAHAHRLGVVHRDLTPANVLLDADGDAHLTDFGIARGEDEARLTGTGPLLGSVPYLSPEQVRGERATPASDVWSLGLVLLEALSGRQEYPGSTAQDAAERLTRPPLVDPGLPEPWPALLLAMTSLDPSGRPSAEEVAAVLRGDSPAVAPLPARTPGQRRVAGVAAAALLSALAAVALVAAGGGPAVPAERSGSPSSRSLEPSASSAPSAPVPAQVQQVTGDQDVVEQPVRGSASSSPATPTATPSTSPSPIASAATPSPAERRVAGGPTPLPVAPSVEPSLPPPPPSQPASPPVATDPPATGAEPLPVAPPTAEATPAPV